MNNWQYYLPTRVVFGIKRMEELSACVNEYSPKKILLVTGMESMKKFGMIDKVKKILAKNKLVIYDRIQPNPGVEVINEGIKLLKKEGCNLVIGLGGGSTIDAAKMISVLIRNKHTVMDYLHKKEKLEKRGLPFIAIPTTAGSGSEVTPFAVITDNDRNTKTTLHHDYLYPDVAFLNPEFTLSLSKRDTAISGLDVLCHAMEAFWSKNCNRISDMFALESMRIVLNNLKQAYNKPDNIEYRTSMMKASLLAGFAFSNTRTTAVHSVSYPITWFFHVSHGLACALTLAAFLEYNSKDMGHKVYDILNVCGSKDINGCKKKIRQLMLDMDLPVRLSDLGINEGDIELITKNGFTPERVKNNPRKLTESDLRDILTNLL